MKNVMKWIMLGLLSIVLLGCGSANPAAGTNGIKPNAAGYGYPVSSDDPFVFKDGMLKSSSLPGLKETKSGDLVFRVPSGWNDFWLAFQEYFDSEDIEFDGDTFFVSFRAY